MEYIGNYQNHNLPKSDLGKLFTYVNDREIIVSYDKNNPFLVEQVSILIDSEYNTYAVFECHVLYKTDVEAKGFATKFTTYLIDFIKQYR